MLVDLCNAYICRILHNVLVDVCNAYNCRILHNVLVDVCNAYNCRMGNFRLEHIFAIFIRQASLTKFNF